jgi:hypothetical protein
MRIGCSGRPPSRVEVILAAVNGDTPVFANGFPETWKWQRASVSISEVVKSAPIYSGHACLMGLEGMVSKHRESAYRAGRSDRWIKVKNRQHPAFSRVRDQF